MLRQRALLGIGTVILAVYILRTSLSQYMPIICPLRRLTGIPCASCGLTRAAVALCNGRLAEAANCNIAALPLALGFGMMLVLFIREAISQRNVIRPIWVRFSGVLTWLAVALLLTAWIVNLHRYFHHGRLQPV